MAFKLVLLNNCSVLKLKADMSMRRAGKASQTVTVKEEDVVVMGTNQAYETVEMRYQSASRSRSPAAAAALVLQNRQEQPDIVDPEEPVYENH